ncbi:hypothetical protein FOL47_011372 [Perkinsus chesapeaki]|uniref:Uncharacterized protein n=1 Tax=Perkinsus chesapeaki TaxID=330153 RepID=A0A7J6MMI5_PERCH|nr:hypothetical protein FOL47_011372 [Perkinsus chesapeaki]
MSVPSGININNGKLISSIYIDGHRIYGNLRGSVEESVVDLTLMKAMKKAGGSPKDLRKLVRSRRRKTSLPHHITWNKGSFICRIMITISKGNKKAVYGSACRIVEDAMEERDLLLSSRDRGASFDKLIELSGVFKTWRNSRHLVKSYFIKWKSIVREKKEMGDEFDVI